MSIILNNSVAYFNRLKYLNFREKSFRGILFKNKKSRSRGFLNRVRKILRGILPANKLIYPANPVKL